MGREITKVGTTEASTADIFGDVDLDGKFEIGGYNDHCQPGIVKEDMPEHPFFCLDHFRVYEIGDSFERDMVLEDSVISQKIKPLVLEKGLSKSSSNMLDTVLGTLACFKDGLEGRKDISSLPQEFLDFYISFISDSIYQKNHIQSEKLISVVMDCENIYKQNQAGWIYTDWNFLNHLNSDSKWQGQFYYAAGKFYYEFYLMKGVIYYQAGFEKIEGEWVLTFKLVRACRSKWRIFEYEVLEDEVFEGETNSTLECN